MASPLKTSSKGESKLSLQEAANLLYVSKPFLCKLVKQGDIAYHKVGNRRYLKLKSVLAYKKVTDAKRRRALRELVAEAQELDMGY